MATEPAALPSEVESLRPVRLEPGDRVLITIDRTWSAEMAKTAHDQLHERFPGVEFTFVAGASGLAVQEHE